jgi:hypothetical protein
MPWAKFDDRFPSNRKVRLLSDGAFRLYVSAICWSAENLTDGVVKTSELRLVADVKAARTRVKELEEAELFEVLEGVGWKIHDYHEYNPTAEQVRADRAAKTARQQRWREKHKGDAPTPEPPRPPRRVDASTDASRDASHDGAGDAAPRTRVPDPTRPDPYPSLSRPTDLTRPTPVAEAHNERETDTPTTDRPATFAEQTIRAANVVAPSQEADFLTWITTTHTPRGTGWWKTVAANGDLPALADDWRTQHAPRAAPAPLPAWCGQCGDGIPLARTNADLRQTEDHNGIRRPCRACHPSAHRKAS